MSQIADNLKQVQEKIARVAKNPVKLVVVTKTMPASAVQEVIQAGAKCIGENRVQEARDKFPELSGLGVEKHLIGHLQSNKAKLAVQLFDWVQSVDSLHLAEVLDKEAGKLNKKLTCLMEINIAGEQSKSGVNPQEVLELMKQLIELKNLSFQGLMTVAPLAENPEAVRPYFKQMAQLKEELEQKLSCPFPYLSMGMTDDFEAALSEGANIVRIGRAIFGERAANK